MSTSAIQAIIETRLKTFADANDIDVGWENDDFVPENDAAYLQFYLMPAPARGVDVAGSTNQFLGVCQINVVGLSGGGRQATAAIADQLESLFTANLQLTDGAITVLVMSPASAGSGKPDNNRYVIPVAFQYRSYL